jgi:hypothetical protein
MDAGGTAFRCSDKRRHLMKVRSSLKSLKRKPGATILGNGGLARLQGAWSVAVNIGADGRSAVSESLHTLGESRRSVRCWTR